jgi:hypothetical protein
MRGYVDVFRYIYFKLSPIRGIILLLSFISLIYSATDLWFDGYFGYIATGLFFISLWMFLKDLYEMQEVDGYRDQCFVDALFDRDVVALTNEEKEEGFVVMKNPEIAGLIIYSECYNRVLRDSDKDFLLIVSRDENKRLLRFLRARDYVFSAFLKRKWWLSFGQKKSFFNELKIGVFSPIRSNVKEITISKVDYYSSFLTNEMSTSYVRHKGGGQTFVLYDGTTVFPKTLNCGIDGKNKILEFGSYIAANHIGASTIAITKDNFIVFWEQSPVAQQSEKCLAPTGSGSLDWSDIKSMKSMKKTVISGLEREFHEESNRKGIKITQGQIEDTVLLGYFRNLMRGGKPEFLALSRLSVNNTVLEPNTREVEEQVNPDRNKVDSLDELKLLVKNYLDKKNLSVPLWVNLLCLQQAMNENPDLIKSFCRLK